MPTKPVCILLDAAVALPRTRVSGPGGALVATAQPDEDIVTLGATAALELLDRHDVRPAALVLATVSAPYTEGGSAQVLAEVLDLTHGELLVLEQTGSTAAGGSALATATALVASDIGPVLVVAADTRRDTAGNALGDAAVALLLGAEGQPGAAELTLVASGAAVVREEWRRPGMAGTERADSSFARVAARPPRPREGIEQRVTSTATGPAIDGVGRAGCAAFPLALLLALDGGDGDVVVSASGVTHRFALTAGPQASRLAEVTRAAVAAGHVGPPPIITEAAGFDPYASQPRSWRDKAQDLRLVGQRDPISGEVLFPPVPAAAAAGLEPFRLARSGRVLTCTRDHIFPQGAPLWMAVVELDGGGRFYGQVVDGRSVAIGDHVTLVLRRLHDGGGVPQWFWKVRPDTPSGPLQPAATAATATAKATKATAATATAKATTAASTT